jgi:hypothetical protein
MFLRKHVKLGFSFIYFNYLLIFFGVSCTVGLITVLNEVLNFICDLLGAARAFLALNNYAKCYEEFNDVQSLFGKGVKTSGFRKILRDLVLEQPYYNKMLEAYKRYYETCSQVADKYHALDRRIPKWSNTSADALQTLQEMVSQLTDVKTAMIHHNFAAWCDSMTNFAFNLHDQVLATADLASMRVMTDVLTKMIFIAPLHKAKFESKLDDARTALASTDGKARNKKVMAALEVFIRIEDKTQPIGDELMKVMQDALAGSQGLFVKDAAEIDKLCKVCNSLFGCLITDGCSQRDLLWHLIALLLNLVPEGLAQRKSLQTSHTGAVNIVELMVALAGAAKESEAEAIVDGTVAASMFEKERNVIRLLDKAQDTQEEDVNGFISADQLDAIFANAKTIIDGWTTKLIAHVQETVDNATTNLAPISAGAPDGKSWLEGMSEETSEDFQLFCLHANATLLEQDSKVLTKGIAVLVKVP